MTKQNCRTLHTETRTFTALQNKKGGGKLREVTEISKSHHAKLRQILEATGVKITWEFKAEKIGETERQWRNQVALLNEKLIQNGAIKPDGE